MKKSIKILLLFMAIMMCCITVCYGFTVNDLTGDQSQVTPLKNAGNSIIKVIATVGIVASVVMLVALGIKYMMGSVEERAEYKKTLLPYLIGAGLVFAASGIAQIVYNLAKDI